MIISGKNRAPIFNAPWRNQRQPAEMRYIGKARRALAENGQAPSGAGSSGLFLRFQSMPSLPARGG